MASQPTARVQRSSQSATHFLGPKPLHEPNGLWLWQIWPGSARKQSKLLGRACMRPAVRSRRPTSSHSWKLAGQCWQSGEATLGSLVLWLRHCKPPDSGCETAPVRVSPRLLRSLQSWGDRQQPSTPAYSTRVHTA